MGGYWGPLLRRVFYNKRAPNDPMWQQVIRGADQNHFSKKYQTPKTKTMAVMLYLHSMLDVPVEVAYPYHWTSK